MKASTRSGPRCILVVIDFTLSGTISDPSYPTMRLLLCADNVAVDVSDVTLPEPLLEAQSLDGDRPPPDQSKEAKEPKDTLRRF